MAFFATTATAPDLELLPAQHDRSMRIYTG